MFANVKHSKSCFQLFKLIHTSFPSPSTLKDSEAKEEKMREEKEESALKKISCSLGHCRRVSGRIDCLVSMNLVITTWCGKGTEASLIPQKAHFHH